MKWLRRGVAVLAWLYPITLLGVVATMQYVGERWWPSGVALYLPRFVWLVPLPFMVLILLGARLKMLLWTQVVAGFLGLFSLMGLVAPWPKFSRAAPTVRVLSYNVNSSYGGPENLVQEIDRYSPDIVLLQEAWSSEATVALLRARYASVNVSSQLVLATRFPVLSTFEPPKVDYRGQARSPRFVQQVLDTPLGHLVVYNVHPISPRQSFYALRGMGLSREILSGRIFSSTSGAAFLENAGLREVQVATFADAARREVDPVIIAGDTNLPDLSFVFHHHLSDYQDGFVKAGSGFGYTFPTNHKPWMRIDRILASGALAFDSFQVGKSMASDHLCVVADLRRRNR